MFVFGLQILVLTAISAGSGFWLWLALGRVTAARSFAWWWHGLAGFAAQSLILQAFVYAGVPLRISVPFMLAVAAGGVGFGAWHLIRQPPDRGRRPGWRFVLLAALGAAAVHTVPVARIGSDRFIGSGQVDQLNYVNVAQFIMERPFDTEWHDIGLEPWLARPIGMKHERLTQSVVLGEAAVATASDSQQAWAGVNVFFIALLGGTAAAFLRQVMRARPVLAVAGGIVASVLPAVMQVAHLGFFSQLATLFCGLALPAVCWRGALPDRAAGGLAAIFLGYMAAAYTELFPVFAASTALLLVWRAPTGRTRLWQPAAVLALACLLPTGYLAFLPEYIAHQTQVAMDPGALTGFAPHAHPWVNLGRCFSDADPIVAAVFAAIVAGAAAIGIGLQNFRRRIAWCAVLGPPLLLAGYFASRPTPPVYPLYKVSVQCAPLLCVLIVGLGAAVERRGSWARWVGRIALVGLLLAAVVGLPARFAVLVRDYGEAATPLWDARERAARADPGAAYLLGGHNGYTGGWMAYFARHLHAYYLRPVLMDRRVPTETFAFRRVPPGVTLHWIDPVRTGPVPDLEPSPVWELRGDVKTISLRGQPAHLVGRRCEMVLRLPTSLPPGPREFVLQIGLTALSAGRGATVSFTGGGAQESIPVADRRFFQTVVRLEPGETRCLLEVQSKTEAGSGPLLLLQSLSLDRGTRLIATDPGLN